MKKRKDFEIIADLQEVECRLSPENLSCDGERSITDQRAEYSRLVRKWDKLVKELGRYPTQGELIPELRRGAELLVTEPGNCG